MNAERRNEDPELCVYAYGALIYLSLNKYIYADVQKVDPVRLRTRHTFTVHSTGTTVSRSWNSESIPMIIPCFTNSKNVNYWLPLSKNIRELWYLLNLWLYRIHKGRCSRYLRTYFAELATGEDRWTRCRQAFKEQSPWYFSAGVVQPHVELLTPRWIPPTNTEELPAKSPRSFPRHLWFHLP